jgi:hypothetical protein
MGGHTTEGRGDTQAVSGRQLVLLVVVAGSRRGIQRAPGHAEHPGTGPPSRCRCGGAAMKAPPTQHTHAAVGHEDEQLIAGDAMHDAECEGFAERTDYGDRIVPKVTVNVVV